MDGIVLLDKPQGLTSTQALQRVRRHLQAEKAGHAGTLDPMATGMLPLCFGQATKACGTLLGRRKAYSATVRLGVATDTGDAEGQPVAEVDVPAFDADRLEQALAALRGERLQVPPMYSALKRDGRPLYELARQGIEVEREARPITIESLVVTGQGDRTLDIEVVCSKGTYVRVLAEEIAAGLGTRAHLVALRRLWVEPFEAAAMVTLAEIEATPAAETARAPWLAAVDTRFSGRARPGARRRAGAPAVPGTHAAVSRQACRTPLITAPTTPLDASSGWSNRGRRGGCRCSDCSCRGPARTEAVQKLE